MDLLCHLRPKPVLPFAGTFRVVDFTLSNCVHSGIKDVVALTDYLRSYLANYLRRWCQANSDPRTFHILEPRAGSYMGTADAVYQNLDFVGKAEKVVVLAGDHVYKMDYRPMLRFHDEVKADITVGVATVPMEQAHRFGTITTGAGGRISEFQEKSPTPSSNLASMGIYVFNKDILAQRLIDDSGEPDSLHDFGYSILPRMVKQDKVFAYRFGGYWQDIGTIDAYYEANMELVRGQPAFSLGGNSPVLTGEQYPSLVTRAHKQASILNSLIGPGCVIKGRVENSILSPGVWVEEEALVRDSVIMHGTHIGYHSVIDRCVLDENVNVGEFCYIGLGTNSSLGKHNITVLGNGVATPSRSAVGRNCRILPHVGPADFLGSVLPNGAVLSPRSAPSSVATKG